jgi:hypothetical protein
MVEFDCRDCGAHVLAYGNPESERCYTCDWIVKRIPLSQQPAVRQRLGVALKGSEERRHGD